MTPEYLAWALKGKEESHRLVRVIGTPGLLCCLLLFSCIVEEMDVRKEAP